MLTKASTIDGYAIAASDGRIGTVHDFLFDDVSWRVRWRGITSCIFVCPALSASSHFRAPALLPDGVGGAVRRGSERPERFRPIPGRETSRSLSHSGRGHSCHHPRPLVSGKDVMYQPGANAGHFIGGDGFADAAATQPHATLYTGDP